MKNIFLVIFFSLAVIVPASAQNVKAQRERKAKLEKEIAIIDKQLSENAAKSTDMLSTLSLIKKKISNRKELIAESEKEIRKYSEQITSKQKGIATLQVKVDTLSAHFSRLVIGAYKNRDPRMWYMYIFASENLGQAFRRMVYFKNLSNQLNVEALALKENQTELETERKELLAMKKEAQVLKDERVKELARLGEEEKQAEEIVASLQKDKEKYTKQLEQKRKQVNALNREIERLVAEAMKRKASKGSKDKMVIDKALNAQFAKNKGRLPWPADGPVVDKFGEKYHPVYKNLKLPSNNGVDIAVKNGTQVCAVFEGVVSQIVVMPGYNKCVLVQHGNYFTFYCKLDATFVKAGDKIEIGQAIGAVGEINGQSLLHFQIWQGNRPQNPELWLK